jgi:hypothetical protein
MNRRPHTIDRLIEATREAVKIGVLSIRAKTHKPLSKHREPLSQPLREITPYFAMIGIFRREWIVPNH